MLLPKQNISESLELPAPKQNVSKQMTAKEVQTRTQMPVTKKLKGGLLEMLAVQMFIAIYFAMDFPHYAFPEALWASKLSESD